MKKQLKIGQSQILVIALYFASALTVPLFHENQTLGITIGASLGGLGITLFICWLVSLVIKNSVVFTVLLSTFLLAFAILFHSAYVMERRVKQIEERDRRLVEDRRRWDRTRQIWMDI